MVLKSGESYSETIRIKAFYDDYELGNQVVPAQIYYSDLNNRNRDGFDSKRFEEVGEICSPYFWVEKRWGQYVVSW